MKRILFALAAALFASCSLVPPAKSGDEHYFLTEVKPVLEQHCLRCHNGSLPPPALNLSSRMAAFTKSVKGMDFIVPGAPDRSRLIVAVKRGGSHPQMMPRTDVSLTDDQIGMLREWIEDGAFWPAGPAGALHPRRSGEVP